MVICLGQDVYLRMASRCHCHSLSLAPVNPDWFYVPGFTFLVSAHPGSPGHSPGGHKTVAAAAAAAVIAVVYRIICSAFSNLTLLVQYQEEHPACKVDEVLMWLSVCSDVQIAGIWSSGYHCHRIISCFIKI